MGMFKDNSGQSWLCPVNISSIERAKEVAGVNLCDVHLGPLYGRLANDDVLLMKVLSGLCKPEIDQRGITVERFYELIQGEPLDTARDEISKGLISFFRPSLRTRMQALIDREEVIRKAEEKAAREMIAELRKQVDGTATESSSTVTDSPESSESIQAN